MKLPGLSIDRAQLKRWLPFGVVAVALIGSAVGVLLAWPRPSVSVAENPTYPVELRKQYAQVVQAVHSLEKRQNTLGVQIVSSADLGRQLSVIQLDANSRQFRDALGDIQSLRQIMSNVNLELNGGNPAQGGAGGVQLPILLYHYPPPNFEDQLVHLELAGYTVVDLDQALAGMHGGPLPAKPVVITFDDGFAAQTGAVDTLLRHHMKATFYIISSGPSSAWCIGAGRRYGDPLQPPGGCGDAYLNWDEVRALDKTGLITIGGHTINHRNLTGLTVEEQRYEINTGKINIEKELGHPIRHFAYPYGAYTAESIVLAQEAGYVTAVTVQPGLFQPAGSDFTLYRERDAMTLP
jgi:peptidoglycan/xylan/chitin deacetylase (PgdA/CDA1 family)